MRSTGTVVYVVSSDITKWARVTELFCSYDVTVVSYSSAGEYLAAKREDQVACLIVDLNLSDISGLEFQRRLAGTGAPPVIFVAAPGDPASCVCAVKNGAVDVLIEPVDPNELLASVELALARDQRCRTERTERLSLLKRWRTLTPRETEVFHHTVAGLLNKQAAAELGVAENTYQVHRGRVMRKMQAESLADLVRMSMKLEQTFKQKSHPGLLMPRPQMVSVEPMMARPMRDHVSFSSRLTSGYGSVVAPAGL
jgi:FixJ family two-component response regulator